VIKLMVDFRVLGGCRGSIGRVLDVSRVLLSLEYTEKVTVNDHGWDLPVSKAKVLAPAALARSKVCIYTFLK
jgi:hypothetical protein